MNQSPIGSGDEPLTERRDTMTESIEFEIAQGELFESVDLDVRSSFVDLNEPRVRTHVFEAGPWDDETPLLFVHGGGAFGAFLAPLIAQFDDSRVIGLDRQGTA